jgi:hypothetical protein
MSETGAFTLCSISYLPQALTLAAGLKAHCPGWRFFIGLVDVAPAAGLVDIPPDVTVVPAESLGLAALDDMARRYNIVELCTALKPTYFRCLLRDHPQLRRLHYIDPDIAVYHSLEVLDQALAELPLLLTPHHLTPIPLDGGFPGENLMMNHGVYNLGYLGLARSPTADRLLAWWEERMRELCIIDLREGYFVDQLWFGLAPIYFPDAGICRHPGANVAFWNLHERQLTPEGAIRFQGGLHPLLFFHFSGHSLKNPLAITRVAVRQGPEQQPALVPFLAAYADSVRQRGWDRVQGIESIYAARHREFERQRDKRGPWGTLIRAARRSVPEPIKRLVRG